MPEIGSPRVSGSRAISATMFRPIGLTAGPQYPPCEPVPPVLGEIDMESRSMPMIELMVLISDTASAPPFFAARAGSRMSEMFGVSFTMTGIFEYCLHQRVTISTYSGTWPTAAPMPRSLMPCGHPKFSSIPSAPVSSTIGRMRFQEASVHGTIRETTSARSGQLRLTRAISSRLIASERSEINSILLSPLTRRSGPNSVP